MPERDIEAFALFHGLSTATAAELRAMMRPLRLRRGDVLFHEGDAGDRLYLLFGGKVKLTARSNDGRETLLAVLGPGEMFGELSFFDPGPRMSTASALVDSDMLELGHDDLMPWLVERPEVAVTMLRAIAHRLRRTNETVSDLVFTDVPGRVAKALLDLAEKFGRQEPDGGIRVAHDLTQEELAQLIGASRETVNKTLADFQNRGWLRVDQRAVVLVDTERLERRAQ